MTVPRVQRHLWHSGVFIFPPWSSTGGAQTGVTKVRDLPQRWWLYARDSKAVWTDSSCSVSALNPRKPGRSASLQKEKKRKEKRAAEWGTRNKSTGKRSRVAAARPDRRLLSAGKSLRSVYLFISWQQHKAMTAADWGCIRSWTQTNLTSKCWIYWFIFIEILLGSSDKNLGATSSQFQ